MPSSNNRFSSFNPAGAVTIPSEGPSNSRRGYGRGARPHPPHRGNGPERYPNNSNRGYVKWRASARRGRASNHRGRGDHHFEHAYPPHQTHHSLTQEDNTTSHYHQYLSQNQHQYNPRLGFARTKPPRQVKRGVDREGDCHMTGTPFIYPRPLWIQMQREIEEEEKLRQRQVPQQSELEKQLDHIINETGFDKPLNNGFGNPINNGFGNPINNGFDNQINNSFANPFPQGYGLPIVDDLIDTPMSDAPQNHANYKRYNIRRFSRAALLYNNLGCRGRRSGPRFDNYF
ncbi:hypothetical protein BJX68DRAFT_263458 [Aspergillus pseudodeflectus]|uniref:Uncharacterized protein n=1 Tax=Aspergillus pseudodeflectus TaxID=176178 RepID=A0ABR4KXB9_9EURO